MCGRFANNETIPVLAGRWAAAGADGAADWQPNDDVRPSQRMPALLDGARGLRLGLMAWGWSRDFARSEDAARKPTFAEAFARRRCLLPAEAWFEWQAGEGGKRKHRLRPDGLATWALAGLWEPVALPDGGRSAAGAAGSWLDGRPAPAPLPAVASAC